MTKSAKRNGSKGTSVITFVQTLVFLAVIGFTYLASSPRMAPQLYSWALFEPRKFCAAEYNPSLLENQPRQDVFFTAKDGRKLHGWYFPVAGAHTTLLVSHGKEGNISDMGDLLSLLLRTGSSVFIYDYEGYGRSEGEPTVNGLCEDGIAAYDWLDRLDRNTEKQSKQPSRIVLYGESLGGAVACQIALHRPAAGLILQSTFSDLRRIGMEQIPVVGLFPPSLFPEPYLDNAAALHHLHCPLLIVHGAQDHLISVAHALDNFKNANPPKQFVMLPHTVHQDIAVSDAAQFISQTRLFLKRG